MSDADALKAAIDLFHLPSQIRAMRLLPLPEGTPLLLRLAADEADAAREAQRLSGRPHYISRQAAIFFVEQILLDPDSDNYRILGLDHGATAAELRSHMALLLKWLHPDVNSDGHRSSMARRVTQAWNQLKSPERRLRHDKTNDLNVGPASATRSRNRLQISARSTSQTTGARIQKRRSYYLVDRSDRPQSQARRLKRLLAFFLRLAKSDAAPRVKPR